MRRLGQEMPALDFTITAPGPGSEHGPRDPADYAGMDLVPVPPAPGWWETFWRDPVGNVTGATGKVIGHVGDVVTGAGRVVGETIGTTVGSAASSAARSATPDWSSVGRVLLFAGLGLGALYLLGPILTGRRR